MPAALPLVFLIAIDAALLAILAFLLIGLARAWLRPLLASIGALFPGGNLVTKAAKWYQALPRFAKIALYPAVPIIGVPIAVAKAVRFVEHRVTQALGAYAAGHMRPVTAFLNGLAAEVTGLSTQLYALANTTWHATAYLTAHTIPAMIEDAFTDFRVTVGDVTHSIGGWVFALDGAIDRLAGRLGRLEETVTNIDVGAIAAELSAGIDALRRQVLSDIDAVAQGLRDGIDALRRETLDLWRATDDKIDALARTLSPAELIAAASAAAVLAVQAAFPNLFCRNTQAASKRLCGISEGLLDSILALTLAFTLLVDPEEIARLALVAEDALEGVIREVAA